VFTGGRPALPGMGFAELRVTAMPQGYLVTVIVLFLTLATGARAAAAERLCDPSVENCRTPLLNLIQAETVGIDIGFWFMEDDRYAQAILAKWDGGRGVPVRVIMDTDANVNYPANKAILEKFAAAGIPMRQKIGRGITHWKMMLFAGQNVVEFSSANFSPHAFVPLEPYVDYIDEVIYFSDDPSVVNSFKTKYDDVWGTTSGFANYANVTSLARHYPTFALDPELNFPPYESFQSRSVKSYARENVGIDSIMFRIMDRAHIDGLIAALQRGARVRLLTEPNQYRDDTGSRIWHSWNVDRLYMAGVAAGVETVRHRAHRGSLHEKATVLHGEKMTIFGSSNWTTSSSNAQLEHNYFTRKPWFYEWFRDNFERKWTNAAGFEESKPFVPLPPDAPVLRLPANAAQNQGTQVTLQWFGGPWAHLYDVYVGTDPATLTRVAGDLPLGPSENSSDVQRYVLSGLQGSTTYYWKIVGKTAALLTRTSPVWSFRTTGTAPSGGAGDVVLYASKAPVVAGDWSVVADGSAAGGARMSNPNRGAPKLGIQANPAHYFEMTFSADAGVPYRLWLRGKATSNSWANDSVNVQFSDSVTDTGSPTYRIGTTSATTVTIEDCSGCGLSAWGWNDNGYGTGALGRSIYFANSGSHTIRIQVREDGLSIDQIVLSRNAFLTTAPGATKNDGTILAESGGSSGGTPPPPSTAPEIVLHTAGATLTGSWQLVDDASAASGKAAVLPDAGRAKVLAAVADPSDYFELSFAAEGGVPYRIWVRSRALDNFKSNDSVHVQFSDSVDASGNPVWRIGAAGGQAINLEPCSGCGISGWGWEDNGWGSPGTLGPTVRFATDGVKTIRVQNREDGLFIDQIVLSPARYLNTAPGSPRNDSTILPPSGGT
jgi:phosphatidylserine/phosphatidylglycerophosphate/cardiolipin synthase-like enzyme